MNGIIYKEMCLVREAEREGSHWKQCTLPPE